LVASLTLVAAACGSDDNDSAATSPASAPASAAPTDTAMTEGRDRDLQWVGFLVLAYGSDWHLLLGARVEVDDAYLGGQRPGGKRGRGAAGKTPFVAAVETTPERKPRRLRLSVVKGFRKKEIEALAKRDFAAGSNVVTDGLSCWTAVEQAGCSHFPMLTGSGPQAVKWVPFTWVNTALGNIKTALAGTYHHISAKHAQRYLASYAWRFNRRFQLDTLTERLAYACARTAPHPYRVIIEG